MPRLVGMRASPARRRDAFEPILRNAIALVAILVAVAACGDDSGKPKRKVNDPCQFNDDCADAVCHYGLCFGTNPGETGAPCAGPGDCKSFVCTSGRCVAGTRAPGEACIYSAECAAGACVLQKCTEVVPDARADLPPADAGVDRGMPDKGTPDKGTPDKGTPDRGAPDKGTPDRGAPDKGTPDRGAPDQAVPDVGPDAPICAGCWIGGACYVHNASNPAEPCQKCDTSKSTSGWSNLPDTTPCVDQVDCTHSDKCSGGTCGGTPYTCDDSIGCTDNVCNGSGGCSFPLQATACLIGLTCHAANAVNPNNPCERCEPAKSQSSWTFFAAAECVAPFLAYDSGTGPVGVSYYGAIAFDATGQMYLRDGYKIYKTDTAGNLTMLAGQAGPGYVTNVVPGLAKFASNSYGGLAIDGTKVYVADTLNRRVRVILGSTLVADVAGNGTTAYVNGPAASASFCLPLGIAVSGSDIFVADGNCIRRIYDAGSGNMQVETWAGGACVCVAGSGTTNASDGALTTARFDHPTALAIVGTTMYVLDLDYGSADRVRTINMVSGNVATLGTALPFDAGWGTNQTIGMAVDTLGSVWVASATAKKYFKIDAAGTVTDFAGSGATGAANGPRLSATFTNPNIIARNPLSGVFYFWDSQSGIRQMAP